ncbi:DEAD/DEAH box helicase [Roseateles terrae]|uniref:ATP-dependent RNA helicase RhlE n=1 Tax=Roseateles terrae TaxID=431060 RepID=A0ABR6GX94_9BURK|nr:DEAD/DEAH box helicase [Roseateles terrae]MBB3196727.1 ATP-dependent RNA helicase RhlE [Roseateles terrae]OWQ84963.1 RNA helicase [Roseateles terrae]
MSFDALGLSQPLLRALAEVGYTSPTPIQAQAIPAVLSGGDLMAGAQTGTGKTAGFTLPVLQRLSTGKPVKDGRGRVAVRALVLTPTRELAAQVEESVRTYGKYLPLTSMVMFGGVGMQPQIDKLRKGVDILVATPGRLLDHAQQGTLDLSHVEILVLDEADRMLDMGFIHDIKKVLALLPAKKQSLLFSATFSDEIKALADRLLDKPGLIEVARRNATADTIAQKIHPVDRDKKKELLAHLIRQHDWHQVLVFTRMKHGANRLAEFLDKQGISAMAIHGNKSQGARTKALAEFKSGDLQVLVATDIAARGIDIDQLPHVVNYELPNVSEDYVHRIGRTGRAGAQGEALSLVCVDEEGFLRDIQKLIKREIPREVVPGFEPDPNAKPEPIVLGRMVLNGGAGRSGGSGRPSGGGGGGQRRGGGGGGRDGHRDGGRDGGRDANRDGGGRDGARSAGGQGRPGGSGGGRPAQGSGRSGGQGGQGGRGQGQGQGGAGGGSGRPAGAPGQARPAHQGQGAGRQGDRRPAGGAGQGGRASGGALTRPKSQS